MLHVCLIFTKELFLIEVAGVHRRIGFRAFLLFAEQRKLLAAREGNYIDRAAKMIQAAFVDSRTVFYMDSFKIPSCFEIK